jgi:hypothetical protein
MARKPVRVDGETTVVTNVKRYCIAHPHGAAAMRHPRVAMDHGRYVAYLQPSVKGGLFGFGTSVDSALHAFDDLYARTAWPRNR